MALSDSQKQQAKKRPGEMSLWQRIQHYVIRREPIDITVDRDEDDDGEFRLKPGVTYKV